LDSAAAWDWAEHVLSVGGVEESGEEGFVHPLKPLRREEEVVLAYAQGHPGVGYKKLTWQMVDEDVVALTSAQVYRILSRAHLLDRWGRTVGGASQEYKEKPTRPNEHWHTDLMYIKVLGMWCFLIAVLDGFSRYVVGWKVLLDMTAQSVSLFMQELVDRVGCASVKLIHDNGSPADLAGFSTGSVIGEYSAYSDSQESSAEQWEGGKVYWVGEAGMSATTQSCNDQGSGKGHRGVYG